MRIDMDFIATPDPQIWVSRAMEDDLRVWTADEGRLARLDRRRGHVA